MEKNYYIGLMTGSSLDGIDGVMVNFDNKNPEVIGHIFTPYHHTLKNALHQLLSASKNEIHQMATLDVILGKLLGETVLNLLSTTHRDPADIKAIGSHGQNIRHCPDGDIPYTLQIGDPNTIAHITKIPTIADFRRRNIALKGKGAPFAPAFHHFLFSDKTENSIILNLGGIANVTFLPKGEKEAAFGFDTGPGNCLMDEWVQLNWDKPFDDGGQLAAKGTVYLPLLQHFLTDPYFKKAPPKSTGREYFNEAWLWTYINKCEKKPSPEDILATLAHLTANAINHAILEIGSPIARVIVCGGGANNQFLLSLLDGFPTKVQTSQAFGFHTQWIEAMAFAWFAKQTLHREPVPLAKVTGANENTLLGGIYFP